MPNITKFSVYLKESSLSRLLNHNVNYDCGILTAFRNAESCGNGDPFSKKDNIARNKSLSSKLYTKGYSVTAISGRYDEGSDGVVKEAGFFVADMKNSDKLENDLVKLGKEFEQDCVLFLPKGALSNKAKAYLIGTNNCDNNFIKYGQKIIQNRVRMGSNDSEILSVVNGRSFIFESVSREIKPSGYMAALALRTMAQKDWRTLDDDVF